MVRWPPFSALGGPHAQKGCFVRRVMFMVLAVAALLAVSASVAGATNRAVSSDQISAKCRTAGTTVAIPTIRVTANAGIKTILVALTDTKILKNFSFTKPGPQTKKISGLKIDTQGLAPGVFTIKIAVTDQRGTRRSIIRRFAICKPVPVFTG
jgi:hypothetical protein